MTELELSVTLGIVPEPEKNRLHVDALLRAEILYLQHIFAITRYQKDSANAPWKDAWMELVPWHSLN